MHVLMLSLTIALTVCVLILGLFALFTSSSLGDRVDHLHESSRH